MPTSAAYDPNADARQTKPVAIRGCSRAYWQCATFTAATLAGFATFAVLAYQVQYRHVVRTAQIR